MTMWAGYQASACFNHLAIAAFTMCKLQLSQLKSIKELSPVVNIWIALEFDCLSWKVLVNFVEFWLDKAVRTLFKPRQDGKLLIRRADTMKCLRKTARCVWNRKAAESSRIRKSQCELCVLMVISFLVGVPLLSSCPETAVWRLCGCRNENSEWGYRP